MMALARALPSIDTSSEEHRHACEVQHLVSLCRDSDRALYLERVFERRGKAAWKRLREDVWAAMKPRPR